MSQTLLHLNCGAVSLKFRVCGTRHSVAALNVVFSTCGRGTGHAHRLICGRREACVGLCRAACGLRGRFGSVENARYPKQEKDAATDPGKYLERFLPLYRLSFFSQSIQRSEI